MPIEKEESMYTSFNYRESIFAAEFRQQAKVFRLHVTLGRNAELFIRYKYISRRFHVTCKFFISAGVSRF